MGRESVSPLLRYLRTMTAASDLRQRTDAELLQCFVVHRDETAFAVLVQRYGPLVLGVCRRLLGHEQDAEDAFQATFLVLASKAASIRRRESVGSFLHGVAERIARKARRTLARRHDRAAPLPEVPMAEATPDLFWQEVRLVLDEEIRRLPRCYREAFILCYLEGQTNTEAARRLGCPKGTVLSRLARARDRLAHQLRRRDITLPAALTTLLTVGSLRAVVPSVLARSTIRLAALLTAENVLPAGAVSAQVLALTTEGVRTMFWKKMTAILAIVLTGSALTATVLAQRTPAPSTAEPSQAIATASVPEEKLAPEPAQEEKKPETRLEKVLRKWAEADENVREMQVNFTRTEKDNTFDTKTITKGQASLKKPDLWRVDLLDKDGRMETVLLLESKRLHRFDFKTKTETILSVPEMLESSRGAGIWLDLSSLLKNWYETLPWLALGPQARDISPRFAVRLVKEDQWYSYLDITPRDREDKKWFSRARVVLNRDGYHVRQLWVEHSNNTEILIDYLDIRTNPRPPITRESLLKTFPKGWKRIEPPKATKDENE